MGSCERCGQAHPRCNGHNTTGAPCMRWPKTGSPVCKKHGGAAPQVIAKAEIRAAQMAAHEQARRMVARAGVDADPIEHLLDSLHVSAAMVAVWGQMVADLDNAGEIQLQDRPGTLRGQAWLEVKTYVADNGKEKVRYEICTDPLMVANREGTLKVHPFVEQYNHWVSERGRLAALCIKAGIAERQVRLEEQKVTAVVDALRATFDDPELGLTPEQRRMGLVKAAGNLRRFELVQGGRAS